MPVVQTKSMDDTMLNQRIRKTEEAIGRLESKLSRCTGSSVFLVEIRNHYQGCIRHHQSLLQQLLEERARNEDRSHAPHRGMTGWPGLERQ